MPAVPCPIRRSRRVIFISLLQSLLYRCLTEHFVTWNVQWRQYDFRNRFQPEFHYDCHHSNRLTQCPFKRCIAPMLLRDHFFKKKKSVLEKEGERDGPATAKYTLWILLLPEREKLQNVRLVLCINVYSNCFLIHCLSDATWCSPALFPSTMGNVLLWKLSIKILSILCFGETVWGNAIGKLDSSLTSGAQSAIQSHVFLLRH